MKLTPQEIKNAIQEHENKIQELQEELKKSSYVTGFERAIERQEYSYITGESEVFQAPEIGSKTDGLSFNCANYGSEKRMSLLEKMNRLQRLLYKFSAENGGDEIDWSDEEQFKYSIFYENLQDEFKIDEAWVSRDINEIYFISEEIAEQALEKFQPLMEEIIKEEQEVKEYYLELNSKVESEEEFRFKIGREFLVGDKIYQVTDRGQDDIDVFYDIQDTMNTEAEVLNFTESELSEIILRGSFNE